MTYKLLLLPGDGIGPEVMAETERVIHWMAKHRDLKFSIERALVGGSALEAEGVPVTEETMALAHAADAVLFGAVGGPQWDNNPFEKKPERGLLRLRKELELFANLRPAICFDALKDASTLRADVVSGLDILIIRELTGGVYFGEPRGIMEMNDGTRRAIDTQVYTTGEIQRISRVAFSLARLRSNRVASAEKSNVMHAEFPDVELTHILADNCAMQLVRRPKQFDVIVTDNLFGDVLSDEAAQCTGSIGMLPSASLGAKDEKTGRQPGLYEPVHGSAPDIAGQGLANPLACVLSFAMCLRYSFNKPDDAKLIERAVERVLDEGLRTGDIMQPGKKQVGTTGMGDAIIAALDRLDLGVAQ